MTSITLEFDGLPPEAAKCAACIDRLGERLQGVVGISSVVMAKDRREVVLALHETAEPKRVEAAARKIMSEVADGYVHDALRIGGMDCPSCASEIEGSLKDIDGVVSASVDFPAARLFVEYELGKVGLPDIQNQVRRLGFSAQKLSDPAKDDSATQVVPLALGGVLWVVGALAPESAKPILYSAATVVSGWRMIVPGLICLRNLKFSTNTLMTVAVIGALSIGEWSEAAAVAWLFALGNFLQARTMNRTRTAVKSLIDSAPRIATIRKNGERREVEIQEVIEGDLIEVKPFAIIPVDGDVVEGNSFVNTSSLTGESEPVWAAPGSEVLAGGVAEGGFLLVRAKGSFTDSTYSKMLELIERGQSARAPQQEMIDRVTAWYTPAVLIGALLLGITLPLLAFRTWEQGLHQAFWLLMVACPCALVISIPVAAVTAIGAASRLGAMVKGAVFLEALPKVKNWAFDKTGTLT
nr:cation-translocating P-type ATPase [Armatimonadota bacterium]